MDKSDVCISMDKPQLYNLGGASATAGKLVDELWPLLAWPKQPLPVLDVGCGPGEIARKVLAPHLPPGTKLVASDVSREMLEFGRKHNALPGTITYEFLDVVDPDVESSAVWQYAPFGKVFCFLLLHWVPNNRRAVQNIHKLLAPDGEAVFSIIANAASFTAYEEMAKDPRWMQYMQHVEKYIPPYQHCEDPVGVFGQLLQSEGFQLLHCDLRPEEPDFLSEGQRREFLKSICPFLNRIPDDQKDEFMDDWIQRSWNLRRMLDTGNSEEPQYCNALNTMVTVARIM